VRGGVSAEFNTGVAAAIAVHPRLSLTGEFLARRIDELRPLMRVAQQHPTIVGVQTIRLGTDEETAGGTVAAGITGFKWNPSGTLVIGAHIRWAFTTTGLTAPLTPAVGVEYGF